MKITPDDPWYPIAGSEYGPNIPGISIRLKLAAEMMKSPHLMKACVATGPVEEPTPGMSHQRLYNIMTKHDLVDGAFALANELIERANRDEAKPEE